MGHFFRINIRIAEGIQGIEAAGVTIENKKEKKNNYELKNRG